MRPDLLIEAGCCLANAAVTVLATVDHTPGVVRVDVRGGDWVCCDQLAVTPATEMRPATVGGAVSSRGGMPVTDRCSRLDVVTFRVELGVCVPEGDKCSDPVAPCAVDPAPPAGTAAAATRTVLRARWALTSLLADEWRCCLNDTGIGCRSVSVVNATGTVEGGCAFTAVTLEALL